MKKKRNRAAGAIRLIVLVASLAVFLYSAYRLYEILHVYHAAGREYDELAAAYTGADEMDSPDSLPAVIPAEEAAETGEQPVITAEEEFVEDADPPFSVDFASLRAINPDVVGWIYVEGIHAINYPICRGEDNDYYLHRTFRREDLFAGSIFMDYRNTGDFSDPSTIIYGHNMKDQSMFGLLKKLRTRETYDAAPYFWILTPTANYRYHVYAAFETRYDSDVYTLFSARGEAFLAWEEKLKGLSEVANDVPLSENDHTVILSTCTSDTSKRCVVIGKCVSSVRPPDPHVDPALFEE